MVLSWVFACSMICKSIVYEKQERLKEMMRVMGLSNGVHWTAWFIDSIVVMIITAVLLSLLLVVSRENDLIVNSKHLKTTTSVELFERKYILHCFSLVGSVKQGVDQPDISFAK
jgi:hypothetical protein